MIKIILAIIGPMPIKFTDPLPKVTVKYDDGTSEVLFDYMPDEVQFTESEFVGLTREEALALHSERLRSEWAVG